MGLKNDIKFVVVALVHVDTIHELYLCAPKGGRMKK